MIVSFFLLLIKNIHTLNSTKDLNYRVLVYTCTDKKYSHFIPLFALALLETNDNIDIEVCIPMKKLSDKEEEALSYLRKKFPSSKIIIDYEAFIMNKKIAIFNNTKFRINSIRFIIEPKLKNKYTYICDVDIINLERNFYLKHIQMMKKTGLVYSNIVRKNDKTHLSGLHFVQTDHYFPVDFRFLKTVNTLINDEALLLLITKNKTKIDYKLTYRPVHGIHMSLNRPNPIGKNGLGGWGIKNETKLNFLKLIKKETYKEISKSFDKIINQQLNKLFKLWKIDKYGNQLKLLKNDL